MSDYYPSAVEVVLREEGGYVNDPNDQGGETNWGISKRDHPGLDIKALTRDQAVSIYRSDYWEPAGCHLLPAPIALAVFDAAVNQGVGTAIKMLQLQLGVKVDGVCGPVTAGAVRTHPDINGLLASYLARRAVRYASTINFDRFAFGWMKRLFRVHRSALLAERTA